MTNSATPASILDAVAVWARQRPSAPALTADGTTLDWDALGTLMRRFAAAMAPAGITPGDRVALLTQNSVEAVAAYLGAIAAGAIAVPLPTSATAAGLATLIGDCAPGLLFADDAGRAALDGQAIAVPVVGPGADATALADFLAGIEPIATPVAVAEADPFNIIYSSGTTGTPKGIVHSHGMRNRQAGRGVFDIGPESAMLLATPLYSNTTLMPLLAAIRHGGHTVLMPKFDAAGYLDLAERHRATHTMLVPVQYRRILDAADFAERDLSSFRVKQCTSAPMAAVLKAEVLARWPGRFLEVYGLTEGGVTVILDASAYPEKLDTVGRPAAGNDIRVVDEDGRFVPAGKAGEVVGRSPFMMSGYWNNAAATRAFRWTGPDGQVYHRSGDIGVFDEDGFLTLLGRQKDLIISGGFNIYPADLEAVLAAHPGVAEAAVIGVPSDRWGESPLALVVNRPGREPSADDLLAWANARLGRMQRLAAIEFRDALPRSPIGKVLKHDLRAPYWPASGGTKA